MNRKYYIAYGSNLNINQMKYRCPNARKLCAAVLENYILNFRGTSRKSGFANIEYCAGNRVPVGIWAISKNDEYSLDMYEGYPQLYTKVYLPFIYGDNEYVGLAYVMRPGHPVMAPADWYSETIREGYKNFGLNPEFLDYSIEKCSVMSSGAKMEELYSTSTTGVAVS